jgi:hypothetical protein
VFPFDESQALEFLRRKKFSGALPEWIPTRPLLLTYLVTKGLLKAAVEAEVSGDFPRGSAWLSLIQMIAFRESDQLEGVDQDSLLLFLGALAVYARQTPDGNTSFSPQQMESIFSAVTGNSIIEDERNLLLRLPGLGAAQDNPINRSFIDKDFLNVCSVSPILRFIVDPYTDSSSGYSFENIVDPLNDVGVEALSTALLRANLQPGVISAAIDRALVADLHQLAFDVFRAAQEIQPPKTLVRFEGISVDEIDLSADEYDSCKVMFAGCIIEKIILPSLDELNQNIQFYDCLVGVVEGRSSKSDLESGQFKDCEIGEFTDEYNVNNKVLDSSLPLGVRVLIVTLRKLFTQGGSSRLESALYRGLDQRSKMIVHEVIALLIRHGFIVETGRKGKITYAGTKSKRSDALHIIQSPNIVGSSLLKECAALS